MVRPLSTPVVKPSRVQEAKTRTLQLAVLGESCGYKCIHRTDCEISWGISGAGKESHPTVGGARFAPKSPWAIEFLM